MRIILSKKLLVLSLVGVLSLVFSSPTLAQNVLSEVEINPHMDAYQVTLKTTKAAEYKKVVKSRDAMLIELKDVSISPSVNTVYNNVPAIDNVTIQPAMNNGVKIYIDGENASLSKVKFQKAKAVAPIPENINLSRPMNTYAPVALEEDESTLEQEQSFLEKITPMINVVKSSPKARQAAKKAFNGKYLIYFGAFLMILAVGLKSVKSNENDNAKIGLSQSLKDKKLLVNNDEIPMIQREKETLRKRQSNSNINANYGMNAYKQSQRNPYTSTLKKPSLSRKRTLTSAPIANSMPTRQTPTMNKPNEEENVLTKAANEILKRPQTQNIDGMKFLNSMSDIYKKNGRSDLAKGLQDNIKKAQLAARF